jgi:TPR repeat protein
MIVYELYISSSYYLGMIYFIDIDAKNDPERARYYLTKASQGGFLDATDLLKYINNSKTDKAVIFKRVFKWHIDNETSQRVNITFNIAWMYYKGLGIDQNCTEAIYHFQNAADQNYIDAQLQLGIFYEKGHGTD